MRVHCLGIASGLLGPLFAVLMLGGCGDRAAQEEAAALLKRQQQRLIQKDAAAPKSREEQLVDTRRFLEQDNPELAIQSLKSLLVASPNDPEVLFVLAQTQHAAGALDLAVQAIEQMPKPAEPEGDGRWQRRAFEAGNDWLTEAGRLSAAERLLTKAIEQFQAGSHSVRFRRRLAENLALQGRRFEASKQLRWLAKRDVITERELFQMQFLRGTVVVDVQKDTGAKGQLNLSLLRQAKQAHAESRSREANAMIRPLSDAFPESASVAAFQMRLAHEMGDDQAWLAQLDQMPPGVAQQPEYWWTLADWYSQSGRDQAAVRCFLETVQLDPTDRVAYYGLAGALSRLGEDQAAAIAKQRGQWLTEASVLYLQFGQQPGTADQLMQLASRLESLGRPWESARWKQLAIRKASQAQQRTLGQSPLSDLMTIDWTQWATEQEAALPDGFQLCGLELSQWEPPDVGVVASTLLADQPVGLASTSSTAFQLVNVAADVGLQFQYDCGSQHEDRTYVYEATGGGIGVVDFDLDGWPDLYFTDGGGLPFDQGSCHPSVVYRNLAGTGYQVVTDSAGGQNGGYGQGVAIADLNQDGFPDVLVANLGRNAIFLNQGDGSFRRLQADAEEPHLINGSFWSSSIACADLSGDGLPELLEVNYIDDPKVLEIYCSGKEDHCSPRQFRPAADRVFTVRADGRIQPWQGMPGIESLPSLGFGVVVADFDQQAGNDVYLTNDGMPNHYWQSQVATDRADATNQQADYMLDEAASLSGNAVGSFGQAPGPMGLAAGDFDRDGNLDLHVTNYSNQPSDLYLQKTPSVFVHSATRWGLAQETFPMVGWGTQSIDVDRDGWLDLVILNGHLHDFQSANRPYRMRPQLYRGGPDGFRRELSQQSDGYWSQPALGRALVTLDWNRDGKTDLVAGDLEAPTALLENRSAGGRVLNLQLVGTDCERDAIGARVEIQIGQQKMVHWVTAGDGLLCSNQKQLSIGVGQAKQVDRVLVRWPTGNISESANVQTNAGYLVIESQDEWFEINRYEDALKSRSQGR